VPGDNAAHAPADLVSSFPWAVATGDHSGDASDDATVASDLQSRLHVPCIIDDVIRPLDGQPAASICPARPVVHTFVRCVRGDHVDEARFGYRL